MSTRLPVAPVLTITPTRTTRLVVVRCPVCHRKHTHGWPYTTDTIGARVAHCVTRNVPPGAPTSYTIPTPRPRSRPNDHHTRRARAELLHPPRRQLEASPNPSAGTAGTTYPMRRHRLPVPEQDHLLPATQPRGPGARHRPPPRDRACKSPSRGRSCHGARPGIHGRRARHSRAVTPPAPPPPGPCSPEPVPAAPPNRTTRSSTRDRKTK